MNDDLLTAALAEMESAAAPAYEASERYLRARVARVRFLRRLWGTAGVLGLAMSAAALWYGTSATSSSPDIEAHDMLVLSVPDPIVPTAEHADAPSVMRSVAPVLADPVLSPSQPTQAAAQEVRPANPAPPAVGIVVPVGPPSYTVEFRRGLDSARHHEQAGRLAWAAAQYGTLATFARLHGDTAAARSMDSCRRLLQGR
ncbi:MAG: hypothetical protein MUC47_06640 [Candidatus Kapabacteria bacterium]|jgi:hypothetical protein|nr:hypothetical protein [Candidatus Kapabacteria bacterium]